MADDDEFVPLDRTFRVLSQTVEGDAYDSERLPWSGETLSWNELLKKRRVVVLSEAGAGKTVEIREQARQLRRQGKAAFFLRLEHVPTEFESAFEVGTFDEFQAWASGMDDGWLLLDSVDEARLRSPQDFEAAIRKVARRLTPAMARAHVVITSRPYAWRAKTDLALCASQLPFSEDVEKADADGSGNSTVRRSATSDGPFTIVALNDLSSSQVERFAGARGLENVPAFLEAIERADAWSFTARPNDLEEVLGFWRTEGRIGRRLELITSSIDRRLSETDAGRAEARPLSNVQALQGAKIAAGACILTRIPTINVLGSDGHLGISIDQILPSWTLNDLSTLLSRPIFDEAIYGTVRFYHRSVREFLCAQWLHGLLTSQTSRRAIEQLLFREQYGMEVVVPETKPVLPWLSLFDDRIRQKVQALAPEVLLGGGDPSALPFDVRGKILEDVVSQIRDGTTSRSEIDWSGLERFAAPDLTACVEHLLLAHLGDEEVATFLLRMIWRGRLVDVRVLAKRIALAEGSTPTVKAAAFRAVTAVGAPTDIQEIRASYLTAPGDLDRDLLSEIVEGLGAENSDVEWLLSALQRVARKDPFDSDHLTYRLDEYIKTLPVPLLAAYIDGVAPLLAHAPVVEKRHCEVSEQHGWLLRSAGHAVLQLVTTKAPQAFDLGALMVLHRLPLATAYDRVDVQEVTDQLAGVVSAWPELNWSLFWHLVGAERRWLDSKSGERLDHHRGVPTWWSFVRLTPDKFDSAAAYIDSRELLDDKLIALTAAFELYVVGGRKPAARAELKKRVAGTPELNDRLRALLKPPPKTAESRKISRMQSDMERRSKARREADNRRKEESLTFIQEHLQDEVISPSLDPQKGITRAQLYLLEQARAAGDDDFRMHYARNGWRHLIPEFGLQIATAFRDSAVSFWRRYVPQLVSEGAAQNSVPYAAVYGLIGLTIEATEVPDWPANLNDDEVRLAFRYAMRELNGFPAWLSKLHQHFPAVIVEMAANEVAFELASEGDGGERHYFLADVSWSGQWLWEALGQKLLTMVTASPAGSAETIRQVVAVLQGSSIDDEALGSLAAHMAMENTNDDHAAIWFAVWIGAHPDAGIASLRKRLSEFAEPEAAAHFAMTFVTQLTGTRRAVSAARGNYRTPDNLKVLYLLISQYVAEADDLRHRGAYSPGLRDDAQEARNILFSQLRDISGKAAFVAMMEIARDHPDANIRLWARRHARSRAEADANGEPWKTQQVAEFNNLLERTPSTSRELFDLALMRFEDLKADLEEGDASEAAILMRVQNETELRNYLGNRLRQSALGRYSLVQEEEFADAKRADLRFHSTAFDAPVPTELKLSHRWTLPQLMERLENQLCGDYLRDIRSGRGLFVLVHQGKQQAWNLPGGQGKVDFAGLVEALAQHWIAVSAQFPGVDEVRFIGIDLTLRGVKVPQ